MSLLMDALKRAEKARQAQGGDGRETPKDPAETQGLTLDPLELAAVSRPPAGPGERQRMPEDSGPLTFDLTDETTSGDARAPRPSGSGLSMEPLAGPDGGPDEIDAREASGPQAAYGEPGPSGRFALIDDVDIDDTSATLPSLKAAQASVDDYFDGTRSMSMSMERPEVEREAHTDTITAERQRVRPDRDAVRAVFDAKGPAPRATRRWASAGFLVLVLLGLLSGGVYLYWAEIGELIGTRPSIVATPPPAPALAPVEPSPAPVAAAAGAFPSPSPAGAPVTGDGAMTGGGQPLPAPSVAEVLAPAQGQEQGQAMAAAPAPMPGPTPAPMPAPMPAAAPAPATTVAAAAPAAAPLALRPGARDDGVPVAGSIRISRRSKPATVPPLLQAGYTAYQAGDDEQASSAYRKVLGTDPNNRDAALGLAAVAVRAERFELAHRLYMQVLSRNPRDSLAMTGLIALTDNVDPLAAESRVKTLLASEPDAAHLHFTLGNLYARQERWPEAQQEYFDAYRQDDQNADYAFNLAVSLDRLVQREPALEYYRLALDLATRRPASFDAVSVTERIRIMTAAGES